MAMSRCVKCEGTTFEIVRNERVRNSNFAFNFIQCTSCGGVVGVVDVYNNADLLIKIAKKLGISV